MYIVTTVSAQLLKYLTHKTLTITTVVYIHHMLVRSVGVLYGLLAVALYIYPIYYNIFRFILHHVCFTFNSRQ